jgi:hypothetical protein
MVTRRGAAVAESYFLAGFAAGIFVAGLLGFIMQQLRFARKKMSALGSPQKVGHETDRTPAQILMDSIAGTFNYAVWLAVLLGLFLGFAWLIARYAL